MLGFVVIGTLWGGLLKTLAAGGIVGVGYLFYEQIRQPAKNVGHRAGGKGFKGESRAEALTCVWIATLESGEKLASDSSEGVTESPPRNTVLGHSFEHLTHSRLPSRFVKDW